MPDWEGTVEHRKEWIQWIEGEYSKANKEKARVVLAVTLKEMQTLIGMVGLGNKEEVDDEIEIAYFISQAYSKRGYITEAAKYLSRWGFNTLKLDYLMAIVEPENIPSQRIVEKCGFTKLETKMILNSGEMEKKPYFYYRLYPSTL